MDSRKIWRARHKGAQRPLCARGRACACMHVACCLGRGRAHSAWHVRVCALKALHDCGVPRTDVCPQSHGRQKGQCNKPCQHRHVRPSRRRAEVRRRTASQRHGPWAHGLWPMADQPGKAWKGPDCRQKGLRQATYDEHTQTCTCVCCCVLLCVAVLCVSVSVARLCVCLCLFVRSCVCLCVCLLVHVCFCFLHASARVRLCI